MKNIRLYYTSWEEMPAEVQAFLVQWMGGCAARGQAFYEWYFYGYNIVHELGHILRSCYGVRGASQWAEEKAVNDLAVAYWRERGETERLARQQEQLGEILSRLADPVPPHEDRVAYFDAHLSELSDPPSYGHYQFSMVLAALGEPMSLAQALRTLVSPQAREAILPPAPPYTAIDANLPPRIVADVRAGLEAFGITLPEVQVVRAYSRALQYVSWD